jgi:hypothetical protein
MDLVAFIQAQPVASVIGSIVGTTIIYWLTQGITANDLKNKLERAEQRTLTLESDLTRLNSEVKRLRSFEQRYNNTKSKLESSIVVKEYCQPVILVGQRSVGKSSLLAQWHTPWNYGGLQATHTHNISIVPIYDGEQSDREPHFADQTIHTRVDIHLQLKVHDFPGELSAQTKIIEEAIKDTVLLRENTGKNLGIVLICMFDAAEAITGRPLQPTIDYYNGDLFKNLRELVAYDKVGLERLVLIFNKSDLLKQSFPAEEDRVLIERCLNTFMPVISSLRSICNPEKVCEVLTNFDRDIVFNNRGEAIVKGEAARNFVKAMAGNQAAQQVVQNNASTNAARFF